MSTARLARRFGNLVLVSSGLCAGALGGQEPVRSVSLILDPDDHLGETVHAHGPFVLIGAPGDDDRGVDAGAAYLMTLGSDGWRQFQKLLPPNDEESRLFGRGVALGTDVALVAESHHAHPLPDTGAVHVFERGARGRWAPTALLHPPEARIGMAFGSGVAVDGSVALVGSHSADGSGDRSGAVFVYHRDADEAWDLGARLVAPDGRFQDHFGASVAVAAGVAVVGAPGRDGVHAESGAVYVFEQHAGSERTWALTGTLNPDPDASPDADFGYALTVNDDTMIVGAPGAASETGLAYLFRHDGRSWRRTAILSAPDGSSGDRFGSTVAMGESALVIGAPGHDAGGAEAGAAYVFTGGRDGEPQWTLAARLLPPVLAPGSKFGNAVAASGPAAIVGAPFADRGAGLTFDVDLSRPAGEILTYERLLTAEGSEPISDVHGLLLDERGLLWLGTLGGLVSYDGYRLRNYRHDPSDDSSLSHNAVLAMLRDRAGRFWVGTEDGLNRFVPRTGLFKRYALPREGLYSRQSIVALHEDRSGRIWTGTNGRLFRYDEHADQFRAIDAFTGEPERRDEPYISAIEGDSRGNLWVLSKNLGANHASLYRVGSAGDRVTRFEVDAAWGQVGPMLIDGDDRLWIKAPLPVSLPTTIAERIAPVAPPVDVPHWGLWEDREGTVWIGTQSGLYRAPAGEREARRHLVVSERDARSPANAVYAFADGTAGGILLGTKAGVFRLVLASGVSRLRLAPGHGSGDRAAAPIVLTDIRVSNREGTTQIRANGLDRIELSYLDYNFSLEYAALTYAHPSSAAYRYQLEGFDRGWVNAGLRRVAMYTNVPPGDYVFRVETIGRQRLRGTRALAVPVHVAPAYWQTTWFRVLLAATGAAIAAAVVQNRRARRREIERLRQRIASDLHDDLSTNLSGIALLGEMVGRTARLDHADASRLRQISGTAHRMVDDLRDIVWLIDPANDSGDDLLLKMKAVASTLLGHLEYDFDAELAPGTGRIGMAQRRNLLMIFKEALHNVVRHSGAERVEIRLGGDDATLWLEVSDDGVGFDPARVLTGHGLRSLRSRARVSRGDLTIDSAPGSGTTIRVDLEVG